MRNVFLAATLAVTQAASAHAHCVDRSSAAGGFSLEFSNGSSIHVTSIADGLVHYIERSSRPGAAEQHQVWHHGIIPRSNRTSGAEISIEYTADPQSLLPLRPGATHHLSFVIKNPKAADRHGRIVVTIGQQSDLTVAGCTYRVWSIRKVNEFYDINHVVEVDDLWSEDLSLTLHKHTRSIRQGSQPAEATHAVTAIRSANPAAAGPR